MCLSKLRRFNESVTVDTCNFCWFSPSTCKSTCFQLGSNPLFFTPNHFYQSSRNLFQAAIMEKPVLTWNWWMSKINCEWDSQEQLFPWKKSVILITRYWNESSSRPDSWLNQLLQQHSPFLFQSSPSLNFSQVFPITSPAWCFPHLCSHSCICKAQQENHAKCIIFGCWMWETKQFSFPEPLHMQSSAGHCCAHPMGWQVPPPNAAQLSYSSSFY